MARRPLKPVPRQCPQPRPARKRHAGGLPGVDAGIRQQSAHQADLLAAQCGQFTRTRRCAMMPFRAETKL